MILTIIAALDTYFSPKEHVDFEIFKFREAEQQPHETIDQFSTRLRKLAATCDFANIDKEVKSAIIQNCLSKRLRRYALLTYIQTLFIHASLNNIQADFHEGRYA